MKGLFFIIAAIFISSVASSIPSSFCSVSANGTVTIYNTYGGNTATLYGNMIRVNNYVRYEFYFDSEHTDLNSSIVVRPDLGEAYFYHPEAKYELYSEECLLCEYGTIYNTLDGFKYSSTTNETDKFIYGQEHELYFNQSTGFVVGEYFEMRQSFFFEITFTYSSWDYDFVNDNGTTFILNNIDECPNEVKAEAKKCNYFNSMPGSFFFRRSC